MWTTDGGMSKCVATSFRRFNILEKAQIPIKYKDEWVSKPVLSSSKEKRFLHSPGFN
jgi:hypothetical protein